LDLEVSDLINYIYSPNGTGKTNVLEAIQCISVGRTLRAEAEIDTVNYHDRDSTVHVSGKFRDDGRDFSHAYGLEVTPIKRKTLLVNKTKTSINDFIGHVPTIWFSPESIKIITSSPRSKRKYFDDVLIQLYPEYNSDLKNYNKSIRHRNKLLQEEFPHPNQIRVWTEQLIKYGAKVIKYRLDFFKKVNEFFLYLDDIHRYKFQIEFLPNIVVDQIFDEDIEHKFREKLRATFSLDQRRGTTNAGPHKDDWNMMIKIEDSLPVGEYASMPVQTEGTTGKLANWQTHEFIRADKFASRGQQRMSLIMLQMVLIRIFEKNLERKPILLLDDIFSELDEENEHILLDFISKNGIQSFITGVDEKHFEGMNNIDLSKLLN
jgi:DNA replication and repair protein RecF